MRNAGGGFNGWWISVYVQTPRKYKRRRDSYIMRVGEYNFELRLREKAIDSIGQGFWYKLKFRIWLGPRELQPVELEGLPGGPHYGELLG